MSWMDTVSGRIDQKSSSSMRGLREALIIAVAGPVFAVQSVQTGSWGGAAFCLVFGAIGIAWVVLWATRTGREQRAACPSPPPPPPLEPFGDDPYLCARVASGRSDLDRLRSQLEIIKGGKGKAGGAGPGAPA